MPPHDSWADEYDTIYELTYGPLYRQFTDACVALVEPHAEAPSRLIDLGAGTGRLAVPLAKSGRSVTAVERSGAMCRVMKRKMQATGVSLTVKRASITDFRVRAKHDLAFCFFSVLNYLPTKTDLAAFARSCAHAIRPGGTLLLGFCEDLATFESFFSTWNPKTGESPDGRLRVERRVSVAHYNGPVYRFSENTVVIRDGLRKEYRDDFRLRSWGRQDVAHALGRAGLVETRVHSEMDRFGELYVSYTRTAPKELRHA